jgi:hypothetical protein
VIFKKPVVIIVNQTKKDMEKDIQKTDVIFRCDKHGDFKGVVFALFPHEVSCYDGSVTFYTHIGQHGLADYKYSMSKSRTATEKESANLKKEMEGLGYNLNIVKKQNYDKYLASYKKVR